MTEKKTRVRPTELVDVIRVYERQTGKINEIVNDDSIRPADKIREIQLQLKLMDAMVEMAQPSKAPF